MQDGRGLGLPSGGGALRAPSSPIKASGSKRGSRARGWSKSGMKPNNSGVSNIESLSPRQAIRYEDDAGGSSGLLPDLDDQIYATPKRVGAGLLQKSKQRSASELQAPHRRNTKLAQGQTVSPPAALAAEDQLSDGPDVFYDSDGCFALAQRIRALPYGLRARLLEFLAKAEASARDGAKTPGDTFLPMLKKDTGLTGVTLPNVSPCKSIKSKSASVACARSVFSNQPASDNAGQLGGIGGGIGGTSGVEVEMDGIEDISGADEDISVGGNKNTDTSPDTRGFDSRANTNNTTGNTNENENNSRATSGNHISPQPPVVARQQNVLGRASASPAPPSTGGLRTRSETGQQAPPATSATSATSSAAASASHKQRLVFEEVNDMRIEILSTWGDSHYVGLTGVELFGESGRVLNMKKVKVDANPRDINVLSGYENDPRVPENLIDDVLRTTSDFHMWLAPFTQNYINTIDLHIGGLKVGACRIWNYNKSRVSTTRGAREIRILINGVERYSGMVNKASGSVTGCVKAATWIFFICDAKYQDVCRKLDKYRRYEIDDTTKKDKEDLRATMNRSINSSIATVQSSAMNPMTTTQLQGLNYCTDETNLNNTQRPFTSHTNVGGIVGPGGTNTNTSNNINNINNIANIDNDINTTCNNEGSRRLQSGPADASTPREDSQGGDLDTETGIVNLSYVDFSTFVEVKSSVTFRILDSWGDIFYYGLTGVEFLDTEEQLIPIKFASAEPRDLNTIPGNSGDQRTVDKLLNGMNITTIDSNMWMAPTTLDPFRKPQTVSFFFSKPARLAAVRVFNYNKSFEDSVRGIKNILLFVDNVLLYKNIVTLKKAPGCALFDYSQMIDITKTNIDNDKQSRICSGGHYVSLNIYSDIPNDTTLQQFPIINNPRAYINPKTMTYIQQLTNGEAAPQPLRIVGFSDAYYAPVEPAGYSVSIIIMSAGNLTLDIEKRSKVCGLDYLCILNPSGKNVCLPNGTVIQTSPEMSSENRWIIDVEKAASVSRDEGTNTFYCPPGTNLGVYTLSFPIPFTLGGVLLRNVPDGLPYEFMIEVDGLLMFTGYMPPERRVYFVPLSASKSLLATRSGDLLPMPSLSTVTFVDK